MSLSGDFSTHQNRRIRPALQNSDKNRLWKKLPFLEITKIWYDKIRFLNSGEVRGKIYTGNILMNAGIKIESRQGDFRSEQIEINEPDGEPVCDG